MSHWRDHTIQMNHRNIEEAKKQCAQGGQYSSLPVCGAVNHKRSDNGHHHDDKDLASIELPAALTKGLAVAHAETVTVTNVGGGKVHATSMGVA